MALCCPSAERHELSPAKPRFPTAAKRSQIGISLLLPPPVAPPPPGPPGPDRSVSKTLLPSVAPDVIRGHSRKDSLQASN